MSITNEFDGKMIYGKGKVYQDCYFEGCVIKKDRFTRFINCHIVDCKGVGKGISTIRNKTFDGCVIRS